MKKIASFCAGLLLLSSTSVFAKGHAAIALEQANAAFIHGEAGETSIMIKHAKYALDHALAASLAAKSVPKTHLDAAAAELQEAIDLGNLGHIGSATKHAQAAVKHIETGNEYMESAVNNQRH